MDVVLDEMSNPKGVDHAGELSLRLGANGTTGVEILFAETYPAIEAGSFSNLGNHPAINNYRMPSSRPESVPALFGFTRGLLHSSIRRR